LTLLEEYMLTDKTICIKALRWRGGLIEWNYDYPQQGATKLWRELTETGRAPDTGERLVSACYFKSGAIEPTKQWSEPA
jgi:hypothetical protein